MVPAVMHAATPTIFLIDDDNSVRRALIRVMESSGLDTRSFATAEDFLAHFNTGDELPPGCVVTDMTLPGMSGLELKIHLNDSRKPIPVILLTANDTAETRAAAHGAGAAGYFRKPVDTQALLDAVRWAINPALSSSTA
jgi:FixJ family two-component response regulator